jgi:demethylmenaquinone methyltransferase/2-methoxy-6-polyprenyl-1,4-benzoquinol methylase
MGNEATDFGYRKVPAKEKARLVSGVFTSVVERYDLMNDVMSMGMHRVIKRMTVKSSGVASGDWVLDLAGGTGDLTIHFSRILGRNGRIVLADINEDMIRAGQRRISKIHTSSNVRYVRANAEALGFKDDTFDCVTISFGVRNFTDKGAALRSVMRALKPHGRLMVLDFSRPRNKLLRRAYHLYSFGFVPLAARVIAGDKDSYCYLSESIRMHPDQEALKEMMENAGFVRCHYRNLFNGIIALHEGTKPARRGKG